MRFVDEYRAPEQVMQLIEHLRERASHLSYTAERPLRIMEVCGGHTHVDSICQCNTPFNYLFRCLNRHG